MSWRAKVEKILSKAKELEKDYDWIEGAALYEQALPIVGKKDFLLKGEIQERIGHCLYRGALQAKTPEQFKSGMLKAVKAHDRAYAFYEKLMDEQKTARMFRCKAVAKNLEHLLTSDPSEKRRLLDECLELEAKALRSSLASGEMLEYGRTYSVLPLVFWQRAKLEWSGQAIKRIYGRGIKWGEKAVAVLSELNALHELAESYFTLSTCLKYMGVFIAEPDEQEIHHSKVVEYLDKAVDLAERTNNSLLLGMSNCLFSVLLEQEECKERAEEALECGERTRDNTLIAWSLSFLAVWTFRKAFGEEDPEKWKELMEEVFQFYDRAHQIYSSMPFLCRSYGFMDFPHGYLAYYWLMAQRESVIEKRLGFLKKAEEAGADAIELAESSGSPKSIENTLAMLGEVQAMCAEMDSDPTKKKHRLEMALRFKERLCQIRDEVEPFCFWERGAALTTLARVKMDLADVESDIATKQRLLEDAAANMEKGLKLLDKEIHFIEKIGHLHYLAALQRDQDHYATVLTRLYNLTKKPEHLRRAIQILEKAITSSNKVGMVSRMAESHWKIAKVQDILGDHLKAAGNFERASDSYLRAAEKIPLLKDFYAEYASYMKAWAELERARHEREHEDYALSGEYYRNCSRHLETAKRWSYLSSYYSAWSLLEHGEELSRLDKPQDAMKTFDEAGRTFGDSANSLRKKAGKLESSEERDEALKLTAIARLRKQCCMGRMLMEEAKLLDRKGDRLSSARRFASAARLFEEIDPKFEREEARRELEFIATLCQAWEKMELAEERRDAALFKKSAELFAKAGQITHKKKAGLIATGNCCFCEALELGTKFMTTSNVDFYSGAKSQMENAAAYYQKAGFEKAALCVGATKRLFDADVYAGKAEAEIEPEKRARLYLVAEECLELSASLFGKADILTGGMRFFKVLKGCVKNVRWRLL